jgi:hypothetical protein
MGLRVGMKSGHSLARLAERDYTRPVKAKVVRVGDASAEEEREGEDVVCHPVAAARAAVPWPERRGPERAAAVSLPALFAPRTFKRKENVMLAKYTIEYTTKFRNHVQTSYYTTDDPVACEKFVEDLLEAGCLIRSIRHEGVDLPRHEFDRIIKTAGGMLASSHICASLGIKPEEEHFRFGFAA